MLLYALDENNIRIFVEDASKGIDYFCVECGAIVRLRSGFEIRPHFYHLELPFSCDHENKSEEHKSLQLFIQNSFPTAMQEVRFATICRVADVVVQEKKLVVEVQCSPIRKEEVIRRMQDYNSIGYDVIWILHEKTFNKAKISAAEHALKSSTHYIATQDGLFDFLWEIEYGLRKTLHFSQAIDLSTIAFRKLIHRTEYVTCFEDRCKTWRYSAQGDCLDAFEKGNFIPEKMEVSQTRSHRPFLTTLQRYMQSLYYYLIETYS